MKNKIRRVLIVIYMLTAVCVFNGCRGQKESFFLSKETDLSENPVPIEDLRSETSEEQMTEIVNNIFKTITSQSNKILK